MRGCGAVMLTTDLFSLQPALSRAATPSSSRFVHITADSSAVDKHVVPESSSETFKVSLAPESFYTYRTDAPSLEVEITKDHLVSLYTEMVKMRRMEMASDQLYKQKLIRGFCHLAIGQVRATGS